MHYRSDAWSAKASLNEQFVISKTSQSHFRLIVFHRLKTATEQLLITNMILSVSI